MRSSQQQKPKHSQCVDTTLTGLGERITQSRLARNLTQTELANLAGVGLSTIVGLEAGKGGIGMSFFLRVLDALGMLEHMEAVLASHRDQQLVQRAIDELPKRARVTRRTKW